MEFKELKDQEDVIQLDQKSKEKLQIIFKHSTVCPISRMAFEKFESRYHVSENDADVYYVGVIEQRPISNFIAEKWNIQHESPQMIVIKNEKAIYNESHLMINSDVLSDFI